MKARTIIALLTLLLAGGAAAWKFIPHTLSHDECSDVYRHFADMRLEGVRITYVQDKVINDTLPSLSPCSKPKPMRVGRP